MNVLNVEDIERELARFAAQAIHPAAQQWVKSVARNHILGRLPEKEIFANFKVYPAKGKLDPFMPRRNNLPDWAVKAMENGQTLHWFDRTQVKRRILWQTLEMIVLWFNSFKPDDTRFRRCDRINFDTAAQAGALWFKDINENVWHYVKDKPPVIKAYDHGFCWVRLTTALHFEREGKIMKHCIYTGNYFEYWRRGEREFYSLRDKQNTPHATVEMDPKGGNRHRGVVRQCKGNSNQRPGPSYQPYIRRFFNDMGWEIGGDQNNID